MKRMSDLNLEGKTIQIFPNDSISKWGTILHVTVEGIVVLVTKVDTECSFESSWEMGQVRFLNWEKLSFVICD